MKTYCENCRYDKFTAIHCIKCLELARSNGVKSIIREDHDYDTVTLNKNNDCKHYKRKWYKFWVK